jgi:hypothetical protein
MGQYFKPTILKENKKTVDKFLYSWDYDNGLKLMEHSYIGNTLVSAFEQLIQDNPQRVVWAGDYADECKGRKSNVYHRCKDSLKANPNQLENATEYAYPFIINHSKKEFVNKHNVKEMSAEWADGMKIHPLPLLTCEGNNRGGGDFRGDEKGIVGRWARDIIEVSVNEPKGFKEIVFDLDE